MKYIYIAFPLQLLNLHIYSLFNACILFPVCDCYKTKFTYEGISVCVDVEEKVGHFRTVHG